MHMSMNTNYAENCTKTKKANKQGIKLSRGTKHKYHILHNKKYRDTEHESALWFLVINDKT